MCVCELVRVWQSKHKFVAGTKMLRQEDGLRVQSISELRHVVGNPENCIPHQNGGREAVQAREDRQELDRGKELDCELWCRMSFWP